MFFLHNRGKERFCSMLSRSVLLACIFVLAAGVGCTPKSSVPTAALETQVPAGDAFSLAVSRMQAGEESVMATPFGPESLVMVEGVYTSGLGQICRKTSVRAGGVSHRVAVCRDETGWFTAEPIFEHVQR